MVPVGYGDGLRRGPGNQVLVGGVRCPVVGNLCLDQLMVRLPRRFPEGEEVVHHRHPGRRSHRPARLAARYGTTQPDMRTHLHARVPGFSWAVDGPVGKEASNMNRPIRNRYRTIAVPGGMAPAQIPNPAGLGLLI